LHAKFPSTRCVTMPARTVAITNSSRAHLYTHVMK
jgi:hypothetical protein